MKTTSSKVVARPFPHLTVHRYWRKMWPFNLKCSLTLAHPSHKIIILALASRGLCAIAELHVGFYVSVILVLQQRWANYGQWSAASPLTHFKRSATCSWNCTVNDPLKAWSEVAKQSTVVVHVCPCVCLSVCLHSVTKNYWPEIVVTW